MRDDFNPLNAAITQRNLCARHARKLRGSERTKYELRADYWEATAARHAEKLGTRLVPLPGSPGVVTADLFLRLAGNGTEGE